MSLLTFRFRQSQAVDFYWNLELAKRGSLREFKVHPNITIYESAFDLFNPIHVGHALSLAKALVLDKRAEVLSGNTSLIMTTVRDVLQCYQQSMQVEDYHAHCWFKIRLTFDLAVTRIEVESDDSGKSFVFPCRCAATHAYGIHYEHPGTIYAQLDSALWRAGTRWCPRLEDLSEIKLVNVELQTKR
ncbi:MAG: hypothetical protein E8D48_01900 [Nitrospira sp.]|nr:MAG: hypothetical protein E8D48_01900 [Nitrospira sp.]